MTEVTQGLLPQNFLIDSSKPRTHQIEELLYKNSLPMRPSDIAAHIYHPYVHPYLGKGKPSAFDHDVRTTMATMEKRGVLIKTSSGFKGPGGWRDMVTYRLSLDSRMPVGVPSYIPFFTRRAKLRRAERAAERSLEVIRLEKSRQPLPELWTDVASNYDQWEAVEAVEAVLGRVSYQIKDDLRSELILYLLEGGRVENLPTVMREKRRAIYRMSSMSPFTLSLDTPRFDGGETWGSYISEEER